MRVYVCVRVSDGASVGLVDAAFVAPISASSTEWCALRNDEHTGHETACSLLAFQRHVIDQKL